MSHPDPDANQRAVAAALRMLASAAEQLEPDEREWMIGEAELVARRSAELAEESAWTPGQER